MSQEMFNKACQACRDFGDAGGTLTNDQLLAIYSRFKQATIGDWNIERPAIYDQTAWAKWYAWSAVKGMNKPEAMTDYVNLARQYLSNEFASRIN